MEDKSENLSDWKGNQKKRKRKRRMLWSLHIKIKMTHCICGVSIMLELRPVLFLNL